MGPAVVIIGSNTNLGKNLANHYKNGRYSSCLVAVSGDSAYETEQDEKVLKWSVRSAISAGNIARKIVNEYQEIEKAYLIYSPGLENRPFHELPYAAIESTIDYQIRGYSFMLRELIALFHKNKRGSLHPIIYTGGSEALPPQDSAAIGYFRSLISGIFAFYQREELSVSGFESSVPESLSFADFIIKNTAENPQKANGKWHRYQEKSSLFDPFRKLK